MFVYQPINLDLKPIKPIKNAIDIRIKLRSGNVFSREFFTGFVDKNLKTLQFVKQILDYESSCTHSN